MKRFLCPVLMVMLLASCAQTPRNIKNVADDDVQMNEAMAQARSTIHTFLTALGKHDSTLTNFGIKVRMEEGHQVEHIWIDDPTYDGTWFSGIVGNDPELVSKVAYGDTVHFLLNRVSDWMYADGGILKGGYTLRVLRDRMSPEERRAFDKELPFKIE